MNNICKSAKFLLLLITLGTYFLLRGENISADPLLTQARKGDIPSQLKLADELMFGRNNRRPAPTLAVYWYRQAALQNSAAGQYNLAMCYLQGWGGEKRPAAAFRYFEKAMYNGVAKAAVYYARMLSEGVPAASDPEGEFPAVAADNGKALQILRKTAKYDNDAELLLAQMLFRRVDIHAVELLNLLQTHAKKANASPEMLLIYAALLRSATGKYCDPAGAVKLLERAAAENYPEAMAQLAEMLHEGFGTPVDHQRAGKLTDAALRAGSPRAMVNRGMEYMTGIRVPHDPHRAFALFTQAAEKKYPPAWRQLGFCHAAGIGTPPDNAKAEECYLQAAQLGDAPAMFKLGEIYRLGGQNLRAALFWYLQGAEHGEVNAMREAGSILYSGNRSSSERETGKKWLQRAADAGDHAAAAKLGISVPALF